MESSEQTLSSVKERTEEWSLLGHFPSTCVSPNHNQKDKQLDGPTCKGKKPTTPNSHTHTHICTHAHARVHHMGTDAQRPGMNSPLVRRR